MLLPTTPSSSLPMTPQTLRDHIAFVSPSINTESEKGGFSVCVLVTLSGLVGTLAG
jgi:hypothetical protein